MTGHLMIKGTKRYRDGQTGQEYRFEWMQFWETVYVAAEQESISKVEGDQSPPEILRSGV